MKIDEYPVVTVILRGYSLEEADAVMQALKGHEDKFAIECTMNSKNAPELISFLQKKYGKKMHIGAGTVLNIQDEIKAIDAGAEFMLSACKFTPEMFKLAQEKGVLTVPGVMTPSGVYDQKVLGADIVKIFPAITVGPKFFAQIQGPLDKMRLMAVGGVNSDNAKAFLDNGVSYLGIGGGMFNKNDVASKNISGLKHSVENLLRAIS